MDRPVPPNIDSKLLQVTAAGFWRQHEIIAVLLNVVLLPVAGLVTRNQHKRRVARGVFQPGRSRLLNKRVKEPQRFTIGNQDALVRLRHMPVKQIRAFNP